MAGALLWRAETAKPLTGTGVAQLIGRCDDGVFDVHLRVFQTSEDFWQQKANSPATGLHQIRITR